MGFNLALQGKDDKNIFLKKLLNHKNKKTLVYTILNTLAKDNVKCYLHHNIQQYK